MYNDKKVYAVIVAAGKGTRIGFDKMMYKIDGIPVVEKSVQAFENNKLVDSIIVVAGDNIDNIKQIAEKYSKVISVVTGGSQRAESVANGLKEIKTEGLVAVHDGARPYVSDDIITNTIISAEKTKAAIPCVSVKDTIKMGNKGVVECSLQRDKLFITQTPQVFCVKTYKHLLENDKDFSITDDAQLFENAGYKVGLIGTIETIIGERVIPSANTTPESILLQKYFAMMLEEGCDCAVMEVSSQGLMLDRTAGFIFDVGIFTNIEPDHIGPNEHTSFEHYLECKKKLLRQCRIGIVNRDDEHFQQIVEGHTCKLETYGFSKEADLRAADCKLLTGKGTLGISYHLEGLMNMDVEVDQPGKFSIYNSLTAIAICRHFHVSPENIKKALKAAKVKGRIEMVKVSDKFTVMIDYAHNAMSLESLLVTLREYHPNRLICLFGCGGNRSRDRRFEMGEVAGKLADLTIITSDNPRNEDPQAIIDDIKTGMEKTEGKYVEIIDRKEAIAYAIHHGEPGDIVVLAGKGHEDYQEICGKKYPMDERVLIREILEEDGVNE